MMTYFKWNEIKDQELITLRAEGLKYPQIAEILGCTYNSAKHRGSQLIKAGIIEAVGHRSSPTGSYSYQTQAPKSSVQELLQYVVNYKSKEACPQPYVGRIIRHFGSWGATLEAANLPPNCGGLMDSTKPTILYLLDFGDFKKIGITQRTIKQRFAGAPAYVVLDSVTTSLNEAREFEEALKQNVASRAFVPEQPWFERNGKTECFIGNETELAQL